MIHIIHPKKTWNDHQNQLDLATNSTFSAPNFCWQNCRKSMRKTAGKVGHDASRSADRTSTQTAFYGEPIVAEDWEKWGQKMKHLCLLEIVLLSGWCIQGWIQKISENIFGCFHGWSEKWSENKTDKSSLEIARTKLWVLHNPQPQEIWNRHRHWGTAR